MQITLYATSTCPYSQQERQYLDGLRLVYATVVLDQEQVRMPEFLTASGGFCAVPVTVIVADDGNKRVVKGYNKEELEKALTAQTQGTTPSDQLQQPTGETPAAPSTPVETPSPVPPTQASEPLPTPEPETPPPAQMPPAPDGESPSPPFTTTTSV